MKILHITALSPFTKNSGIPAVLKGLTDEQNKIDMVKAKVLSLKSEVSCMESEAFEYINGTDYGKYLDNFKPDAVIFHSFFHIEYAFFCYALLKRGISFYIEPHGSFGKQAMQKSRVKKIVANNTFFSPLIKKAKGYIFTNIAEYNDSVYYTLNDVVVPNGIDLSNIDLQYNEKPIGENFRFYYLGRYDIHHKGIDYLLDALDILEKKNLKINIDFYGIGTNEQVAFINKRINKYCYVKARECGPIYGDDKKNALNNSNVLVLTSRYEGSPMTVLDALSYGNPCVVTPGTNVADELVENHIGWKTELNADAIAKQLILAREDYLYRHDFYIKHCKQYVIDKYTWEKLAKQAVEYLSK